MSVLLIKNWWIFFISIHSWFHFNPLLNSSDMIAPRLLSRQFFTNNITPSNQPSNFHWTMRCNVCSFLQTAIFKSRFPFTRWSHRVYLKLSAICNIKNIEIGARYSKWTLYIQVGAPLNIPSPKANPRQCYFIILLVYTVFPLPGQGFGYSYAPKKLGPHCIAHLSKALWIIINNNNNNNNK